MNARQALTRCRRCRRACIAPRTYWNLLRYTCHPCRGIRVEWSPQIRAQVDQLSDDITAAVFRVLHEVRP